MRPSHLARKGTPIVVVVVEVVVVVRRVEEGLIPSLLSMIGMVASG